MMGACGFSCPWPGKSLAGKLEVGFAGQPSGLVLVLVCMNPGIESVGLGRVDTRERLLLLQLGLPTAVGGPPWGALPCKQPADSVV